MQPRDAAGTALGTATHVSSLYLQHYYSPQHKVNLPRLRAFWASCVMASASSRITSLKPFLAGGKEKMTDVGHNFKQTTKTQMQPTYPSSRNKGGVEPGKEGFLLIHLSFQATSFEQPWLNLQQVTGTMTPGYG